MRQDSAQATFIDVAVIGGGPAGLSGALYLARFCRQVMVFDDGRSRASRISRSHNVAGFENGIEGHRLLHTMRLQCAAVGVRFVDGHVSSMIMEEGNFSLQCDDDVVTARAVLIATGASDVEPSMEGLAEAVHEGAIRYCPVCDGYEIRGRMVGVLCDSTKGIGEALYLRHFTPKIHMFATSRDIVFSDAERRRIADAGIVLHESGVRALLLDARNTRFAFERRDGVAVRHWPPPLR